MFKKGENYDCFMKNNEICGKLRKGANFVAAKKHDVSPMPLEAIIIIFIIFGMHPNMNGTFHFQLGSLEFICFEVSLHWEVCTT